MILEREDLIARTAAFIGVIGTLLSLPHWFEANFEARIPSSFSSLKLTIAGGDEEETAEPGPAIVAPEELHGDERDQRESLIKEENVPPEEIVEPEVAEPPAVQETIEEPPAPQENIEQSLQPQLAPLPAPEPEPVSAPEPAPKPVPQKAAELNLPDPKPVAPSAPVKEKEQPANKPQEKPQPAPAQKPRETTAQATAAPAAPKPQEDNSAKARPAAASNPASSGDGGSSAKANNSGATQSTTAADGTDNRSVLQSRLLSLIRSKTNYPRTAIRRKMEGEVLIEFKLKEGTVTDFVLVQGSGYKLLDEAALKLAKSLQGTVLIKTSGEISLRVPIIYRLI